MTDSKALATATKPVNLIAEMAEDWGFENPRALYDTVNKTLMPMKPGGGGEKVVASREELSAFLLVAKKYGLDPWTRQIMAFPMKGGGIRAMVGYDGFLAIVNGQSDFRGFDVEMDWGDRTPGPRIAPIACTVTVRREVGGETIEIPKTCYYHEWAVAKNPNWQDRPAHMLEVRATCQAVRKAYGITGINDRDELEEMNAREAEYEVKASTRKPTTKATLSLEKATVKQGEEHDPKAEQEAEEPKQEGPPKRKRRTKAVLQMSKIQRGKLIRLAQEKDVPTHALWDMARASGHVYEHDTVAIGDDMTDFEIASWALTEPVYKAMMVALKALETPQPEEHPADGPSETEPDPSELAPSAAQEPNPLAEFQQMLAALMKQKGLDSEDISTLLKEEFNGAALTELEEDERASLLEGIRTDEWFEDDEEEGSA